MNSLSLDVIPKAHCLMKILSSKSRKKFLSVQSVVPWRIVPITLNGTIGLKVKQSYRSNEQPFSNVSMLYVNDLSVLRLLSGFKMTACPRGIRKKVISARRLNGLGSS